jgi:hypothetical protein
VAWSKVSGPGTVTFTAPANADTNATFSTAGTYVLRLTATGPGPVTVTDDLTIIAEETYDAWAARTLAAYSSADRLRTADPDRDGLANLAEYILAGNPAAPDAGGATTLRMENSLLTLEYHRPSSADAAVLVVPEFSADTAGGWSADAGLIFHRMTGESGGLQTWQATLTEPVTPHQRRFLRLRIAAP